MGFWLSIYCHPQTLMFPLPLCRGAGGGVGRGESQDGQLGPSFFSFTPARPTQPLAHSSLWTEERLLFSAGWGLCRLPLPALELSGILCSSRSSGKPDCMGLLTCLCPAPVTFPEPRGIIGIHQCRAFQPCDPRPLSHLLEAHASSLLEPGILPLDSGLGPSSLWQLHLKNKK